jgi:hypothetical protein
MVNATDPLTAARAEALFNSNQSAFSRANALLTGIVAFGYEETFLAEHQRNPDARRCLPCQLEVEWDDEWAASLPDRLHRDGEPLTFDHLSVPCNAADGANIISPAVREEDPPAVHDSAPGCTWRAKLQLNVNRKALTEQLKPVTR